MNKDGKYYIYENVASRKIHICKNKHILAYELHYLYRKPVSVHKLRDFYSIIGEIDTVGQPSITMYSNDRIGELFRQIVTKIMEN
jgi:hypothetical protein